MMTHDDPLQSLLQVVNQMKAIGNLNRIGGAARGTLDVLITSVSADDFNAGMLLQP